MDNEKISDMPPGSYFGEQCFLFGGNNQMSVKATTYCEVLILLTKDFNKFLLDFPVHRE